jgi:hypothetical protein
MLVGVFVVSLFAASTTAELALNPQPLLPDHRDQLDRPMIADNAGATDQHVSLAIVSPSEHTVASDSGAQIRDGIKTLAIGFATQPSSLEKVVNNNRRKH